MNDKFSSYEIARCPDGFSQEVFINAPVDIVPYRFRKRRKRRKSQEQIKKYQDEREMAKYGIIDYLPDNKPLINPVNAFFVQSIPVHISF